MASRGNRRRVRVVGGVVPHRLRSLRSLLMVPVLLLAACGSGETSVGTGGGEGSSTTTATDSEQGGISEGEAALGDARARWEAAGIEDYEMTYQRTCFCPMEETTVVVRGGEVAEAVLRRDGEEVPVSEVDAEPMTVDDLFADIAAAYAEGVASVEATYDPEIGRPTDYFIDVSEMMADEEHGISVRSFTAAGVRTTSTTVDPSTSTTSTGAPVGSVDLSTLTESWGCGLQLSAGDPAQTRALTLVWNGAGGAPPADGDVGARGTDGPGWEGTLAFGTELFANWCNDVVIAGAPAPEVSESWTIVAGTVTLDAPPPADSPCPTVVRGTARGLVARTASGDEQALGDVSLVNGSWGCFAG